MANNELLQVGTEEPVAPQHDDAKRELFALLRQMGRRNHRSKKEQLKLFEEGSAPAPNKNLSALWPEYKGPDPTDARNLGKT